MTDYCFYYPISSKIPIMFPNGEEQQSSIGVGSPKAPSAGESSSMRNDGHYLHIPVMGTGYSADTPIRVAHLGITSVISILDDVLLEKLRQFHCRQNDLPYGEIRSTDPNRRAKRITAYLNLVKKIVDRKLSETKGLPFFEENEKQKYFDLLPETSTLKMAYRQLLAMSPGPQRDRQEQVLTDRMVAGAIDVNIMVRLDRPRFTPSGEPLGEEFSDARSALRGYAESHLDSAIVFSAGVNKGLFSYLTRFPDFYRDKTGRIRKRIILKVSDFRSALIQGKFLAKKGLEVAEYRIESGLNCGGHAFFSAGKLLPDLLEEFKAHRDRLAEEFQPAIKAFYDQQGWGYGAEEGTTAPLVTVQGGIGTHGEILRLRNDFGMDLTGVATPFLLVPEVTRVDAQTREILRQAGEDDLYTSDVSPLGVPFNNVRNSGSEQWIKKKAASATPGANCTKGILALNSDYAPWMCTASKAYQQLKLAEIEALPASAEVKSAMRRKAVNKACLCEQLGNSALIELGLKTAENAPQAICPGPNLAWFNRFYRLQEMIDHFYGRGVSLVPAERPHMFAKELVMTVDFFENLIEASDASAREAERLAGILANIEAGVQICLQIAGQTPYPGENLASIAPCVKAQKARLVELERRLAQKAAVNSGDDRDNASTPGAKAPAFAG